MAAKREYTLFGLDVVSQRSIVHLPRMLTAQRSHGMMNRNNNLSPIMVVDDMQNTDVEAPTKPRNDALSHRQLDIRRHSIIPLVIGRINIPAFHQVGRV